MQDICEGHFFITWNTGLLSKKKDQQVKGKNMLTANSV
jgi:hypothetical protein